MNHLQSTGGRLMVRPRRRTPALPEASKSVILWGHSSAGRAPAWHAGGQRFDPAWLHQIPPCDMIRDTGTSRPLPPSSRKLIFSQQKPVYMAARDNGGGGADAMMAAVVDQGDRKSTRLNSSN